MSAAAQTSEIKKAAWIYDVVTWLQIQATNYFFWPWNFHLSFVIKFLGSVHGAKSRVGYFGNVVIEP